MEINKESVFNIGIAVMILFSAAMSIWVTISLFTRQHYILASIAVLLLLAVIALVVIYFGEVNK